MLQCHTKYNYPDLEATVDLRAPANVMAVAESHADFILTERCEFSEFEVVIWTLCSIVLGSRVALDTDEKSLEDDSLEGRTFAAEVLDDKLGATFRSGLTAEVFDVLVPMLTFFIGLPRHNITDTWNLDMN